VSELEIFTGLLIASLILMIWSVLYRENVFYRIAEHLAIGSFLGYNVFQALNTMYEKTFIPLFRTPDWSIILVAMLGFLLWLRLVPQLSWISRWSLAVLAGVSMGVGARGALSAQLVGQTNMASWIVPGDLAATIGTIVLGLFAIGCIFYFVYTYKPKGPLVYVTHIGRLALMVTFGVVMGTYLMANIAYPIGQLPNLVTWPGYILTAIAVVLIIADIVRQPRKAQ